MRIFSLTIKTGTTLMISSFIVGNHASYTLYLTYVPLFLLSNNQLFP